MRGGLLGVVGVGGVALYPDRRHSRVENITYELKSSVCKKTRRSFEASHCGMFLRTEKAVRFTLKTKHFPDALDSRHNDIPISPNVSPDALLPLYIIRWADFRLTAPKFIRA